MSNSSKAAIVVLLASLGARAAEPAPAAAPASAAASAPMEDTVAVVNGEPILLSAYQKELAGSLAYWNQTNPGALADPAIVRKIRENQLDEMINQQLLIQQAEREKIKVHPHEIEHAVDEIKARFKKDDSGRELSDAESEKAFSNKLKQEGVDYDQFTDRLRRRVMAKKVVDENVKEKLAPPTEAETHAYFDKVEAYLAAKTTDTPAGMDETDAEALREAAHQIKALSSERVRVQRILIRLSPGASENEHKRALRTAQDLKKRLDQGEDFAKVAKDESEDPESAARGGDIGYVLHGVAPEPLDKAAFSMDVGQTSDPILTDIGYSIIRITEKRAAETPDFDHLKEDLSNFIGSVSSQKKFETFMKSLRDGAVIEKHLPATP
jgi:parvulin-like peptidyl-prolyl isomerase